MAIYGIVVEYNPFHNGHLWQIQQIKNQKDCSAIVICMSGNFVQRGEPALLDKWKRTELALAYGVDLVIELPVAFAVQPADIFARGAVAILQEAGCDKLAFGVENGEGYEFQELGQWLEQNEKQVNEAIEKDSQNNQNYKQLYSETLRKIAPDTSIDFTQPNNTLALAYAKENAAYEKPLELFSIPRKESRHRDTVLNKEAKINSATAIRKHFFEKDSIEEIRSLPALTKTMLADSSGMNWERLWPYLKYRLLVSSKKELRSIYQVTEGLENRLKDKIKPDLSYISFMRELETKRYSKARLNRMLTYILLGLESHMMETELRRDVFIRVLGFRERGQEILSDLKHQTDSQILTNISKNKAEFCHVDIRAGKIYQLGSKDALPSQDFFRKPIIMNSDKKEE